MYIKKINITSSIINSNTSEFFVIFKFIFIFSLDSSKKSFFSELSVDTLELLSSSSSFLSKLLIILFFLKFLWLELFVLLGYLFVSSFISNKSFIFNYFKIKKNEKKKKE